MSGAAIEIKIDDKKVRDMISGIRTRLGHVKPAMLDIGEIIRTSVERNFAAGGRPEKWKESGRVKNGGGQTLSDTARLRRSITVNADETAVRIGTNVEYAATHQFGAKKGSFGTFMVPVRAHQRKGKPVRAHTRSVKLPWGDIPARPFLMVQEEDWTEIRHALNDYLVGDKI